MTEVSDSRARRTAEHFGLYARKSRARLGTPDNRGGYTLLDPSTGSVVAGEKFDLTAADVVEYCREALEDLKKASSAL